MVSITSPPVHPALRETHKRSGPHRGIASYVDQDKQRRTKMARPTLQWNEGSSVWSHFDYYVVCTSEEFVASMFLRNAGLTHPMWVVLPSSPPTSAAAQRLWGPSTHSASRCCARTDGLRSFE